MNANSTTFRFAGLVFLFQILAAAVLLFGLGALLRSQSRDAAISRAETMRTDLLESYQFGGAEALGQAVDGRLMAGGSRGAVLFLADARGKPIAGNLRQVPPRLAPSRGYTLLKVARTDHVMPEAMFLRVGRLTGGELFVTGTIVESERKVLAQLERASLAALALSIVFAGFAAFVSTRLITDRLRATVATLRNVRGGDLSQRVPRDGTRDAFGLLGSEVNATLDRVETLNAELKIATDTLAHDLKSPLTRMKSALDRLGRTVREPEALASVDQALAESERLMAMIETALSITRAEAGLGRESFERTNLTEMLATIVEIYAPMVEDEGRMITLNASSAVIVPIHRQLMDQAIGNLIDNAIKYGAGAITLSVRNVEGGVLIAVADEGPGIPPERHAQALARFQRLDDARGGWGAGLGLSLVQAVARLHSGTMELRDHAPGLEVAIVLGGQADPAA
ncbi:signal transduction histidine kinase [Novosphingobium fluoreni]|uniref:histidine kinase n=1 Tax=Novosphingobium fluoreni TaxID=1391222 RepID=A0A7W6C116_9SPHN|nr:signal transduction histidine kinase [Novosphingobium fluoreni]